jgi:CIC family chloride channel protein
MTGKILLLSLLVGLVTGCFVVFYALLTKALSFFLFLGDPMKTIPWLPIWYIYLIPIVSIYLVNVLISKNGTVQEYGVKEIAEAVEQNRLSFSVKDLFLKTFASSLSLASGFAVGNEGPSAAIGAMIAFKFHKLLKLPQKFIRIALSVGASSGIAAIFVSPVTGIAFAIENIAYEFVRNYAAFLITGSVLAFSVAAYFLEPLVFNYSTGKTLDYHYLLATLLFIPVITFFIYIYLLLKDKILFFLQNKFETHLKKYKNIILAILSGSTIATILLLTPYAGFSGHEVVKILINEKLHLPVLSISILIILRILATTISLYANAVGGLFISLMSIGALIGYGFGEVSQIFLMWNIEPFYFAAIGSAVFMGVLMKLPLTAIVLALETTYDYNVLVPTGLSVVIVTYLTTLQFDLHKLNLKEE